MSSSLHYRPEIDGLRCLAVLAVIAFHLKASFLPGGYLGVDVFFVISGYLITSIIVRENAEGRFSLVRFWDRRIKRILPAATTVLLVVSVTQDFIIFRPDLRQLFLQKIAALLSVANIYHWRHVADYWGNKASEFPFLHYWSLSAEEQYYLLYPLLLIFLFKKAPSRLPSVLLLLTVASFCLFAWGAVHCQSATFYMLPTRAWELGAGCLLALFAHRQPFPASSVGTLIGTALIALAYLFPINVSGIGYGSFVAVLGACLIIGSGSNRAAATLFQNAPSIFIGRISYSLYLWHWPVILTLRNFRDYDVRISSAAMALAGLVTLLLLSLLSYCLIEQPFRRFRYGSPLALGFALVVGIFFIAIEPGFLKRPYPSTYDKPFSYSSYYDLRPILTIPEAYASIVNSVNTPAREASATAYKEGGIIRHRSTPDPSIVLLGDSHGVMFAKVIDDVTEKLNLSVAFLVMNGESPTFHSEANSNTGEYLSSNERKEYDIQRKHFIEKWNPDIVIIATQWERITEDGSRDLFQFLEANAKTVLLVESPPVLDFVGNRSFYQYLSFLGSSVQHSSDAYQIWPRVNLSDTAHTREKLLRYVSARTNFAFLPIADLFLKDGGVIVSGNNKVFYLDDDHLTFEGTNLTAERITAAIQNILSGHSSSFPLVSDDKEESRKTLQKTALPSNL